MMAGTVKQRPMKAGENPYFFMCTENVGAKYWMLKATMTCAAMPKKNLGIVNSKATSMSSNCFLRSSSSAYVCLVL